VLAALGWLLPAASPAPQKKRAPEPHALISGTVFRETGLTLRGAEVTLERAEKGGAGKGFKKTTVATDARGEFAVRVPAGPMRYTVTIKAAGYRTVQKEVSVAGEEAVNFFVQLEPQR